MESKPFFFDTNNFDDDAPGALKEEKPPEPEFTKDELEAAKAAAFEKGRQSGLEESEQSHTKALLGIGEKIERDMKVLLAAEKERDTIYEQEAVHLTLLIIKKLFPVYSRHHGDKELETALHDALQSHADIERIVLEVSPAFKDKAETFLKDHKNTGKWQLSVKANETLQHDACRLLWPEGGLIINRSQIAEKIFNVMKQTLAERGVSVHDEGIEETDAETIEPEQKDSAENDIPENAEQAGDA